MPQIQAVEKQDPQMKSVHHPNTPRPLSSSSRVNRTPDSSIGNGELSQPTIVESNLGSPQPSTSAASNYYFIPSDVRPLPKAGE